MIETENSKGIDFIKCLLTFFMNIISECKYICDETKEIKKLHTKSNINNK
jgi:hypothetical protein